MATDVGTTPLHRPLPRPLLDRAADQPAEPARVPGANGQRVRAARLCRHLLQGQASAEDAEHDPARSANPLAAKPRISRPRPSGASSCS